MTTRPLSLLDTNHVEAISEMAGEPDWLRRYRLDSLSVYGGLPIETSPLYGKYTDAAKMDPETISISTDAVEETPSFLSERLKELDGEAYVLQAGSSIREIQVPDAMRSAGVTVTSVFDAVLDNAELVRAALHASKPSEDRFTALNNAAFNTGVFVDIPDDAILERPLHLVTTLPEDGISAISRNIISAGSNSRATIVQEIYSPEGRRGQAYLELLNTSVAGGARLDVTTLQMMKQDSYNFSTRRTDLAADSTVNWYLGLFGALLSRYRIGYHLNGSGASANDSEVVFGNAEQSFDLQAELIHNGPATEGRITEKSILREKSRSLFKGMIRINENASKSNSYLSGRSILLGSEAKSDAIPGLEILTNDVKATHSASVAQIDEEQIFYLMSRCLTKAGAERTIVEGFLEPLSRKMSTQIRAWIAHLVESKWEGKRLSINTDEELRKFIEVEETRYNENAEIEQHYKYRR